MIEKIIFIIKNFIKKLLENNDDGQEVISVQKERTLCYFSKPFLTEYEKGFYEKIKCLNDSYIVVPQVNLAVDKVNNNKRFTYRSELFRNIDFGIFSKDFNLLLLIEVDDKTHNFKKRQMRDNKVKKILDECEIKLIHFYTFKTE